MEMTQLIWIIAVTLLALLNIVWQFDLQTRQRRLRERYNQIRAGADGVEFQVSLESLMTRIEEVQGKVGRLEALTRQLGATLEHSVQGIGMVRFRAYQDTGGDQSFSLALVDGDGDGLVMSALYSRDGTRVYGKPLASWTSAYPLTDEEKEALDQARKMAEGG
jgi:hypothetical protein